MGESGRSAARAREALAAGVVLPVLRTGSADEAVVQAAWAIEQGLPAVELTATTPGWRDASPSSETASRRSSRGWGRS